MMGFAGGAPLPTGALPHLQSPAGVDGVDDGDSDNLFCGGVRFKCYTLHLSSTELNIQCVPKISCSQNFEDSAGRSNFWAKVVQSGPNWPKMALCPSGPSKPGWPKHVQKFSLPTSFSKLCWQLVWDILYLATCFDERQPQHQS